MLERLMGDEDLAEHIISAFREDIPGRLEALARALQDQDAPGVVLQAHTIKGAAANLGAEQMREIAGVIEAASNAGDLATAQARFPELALQFTRWQEATNASLTRS